MVACLEFLQAVLDQMRGQSGISRRRCLAARLDGGIRSGGNLPILAEQALFTSRRKCLLVQQ